mgnify:CR=1 FL=1
MKWEKLSQSFLDSSFSGKYFTKTLCARVFNTCWAALSAKTWSSGDIRTQQPREWNNKCGWPREIVPRSSLTCPCTSCSQRKFKPNATKAQRQTKQPMTNWLVSLIGKQIKSKIYSSLTKLMNTYMFYNGIEGNKLPS